MKKGRFAISLGIAFAVIAAVCFIPLPHHVDCAFEVEPSKDTLTVYAGSQGRVKDVLVKPGDLVRKDQTLMVLENPELEIQLEMLRGQEIQAKQRLKLLGDLVHEDRDVASGQEKAQKELLQSLQESLQKTEERYQRLVIKAPRDGVVLPPPRKESQNGGDGQLPSWSGSPLEEENSGAALADADVVCLIGSPTALDAVLFVDQGDTDLVKKDQIVDLKFDAARTLTYYGQLSEIASTTIGTVSMAVSSQTGGDLETEIDPTTGQARPRSATFPARVSLEAIDFPAYIGYRGSAKVHTDPKSLGWRLWRLIAQTFNFEL